MRKYCLMFALFVASNLLFAGEQNPAEQLLNNGNMEQGSGKGLDGWRLDKKAPKGVTVALDKELKHGGESSMKIAIPESAAGKAIKIQQEVKGFSERKIRLSGFTQATKGLKTLRIVLQCFDNKWKQVGWIDLAYVKNSSEKWVAFDKTITMPEGTRHPMLTILVTGTGECSISLDDLLLTESE